MINIPPIEWEPIEIHSQQDRNPDQISIHIRQYGTAGESRYKRGCVFVMSTEVVMSKLSFIPEMGSYPVERVS